MRVICGQCGNAFTRTGTAQKFCKACGDKRRRDRGRRWASANPLPETRKREKAEQTKAREAIRREAAEANTPNATSLAWDASAPVDLEWLVRVSVPFSYAASKNAVWRFGRGTVFARKESNTWKGLLQTTLEKALRPHVVVTNKVWLDLFVQKPNHRGDAVNVVDSVCDAVKKALGVDDRWFSIRRLDWEIVKHRPMLHVGVGQTSSEHLQACAVCGRLQPLDAFSLNRTAKNGRVRECGECRSVLRKHRPRVELEVTELAPEQPELFEVLPTDRAAEQRIGQLLREKREAEPLPQRLRRLASANHVDHRGGE